jgi:hypothetical protein
VAHSSNRSTKQQQQQKTKQEKGDEGPCIAAPQEERERDRVGFFQYVVLVRMGCYISKSYI